MGSLPKAVLAVTLALLPAPALADWKPFIAAADGFEIAFPTDPEVTANQDDVTLLSDHAYTVAGDASLARVQVVHFFQAPGGDNPALDLFRSVLRSDGCPPGSIAPLSVEKGVAFESRDLCQDGAYGFLHRLYLSGDWAWLLLYAGPPGTEKSADAARFADSFHLVGK